MTSFWEIEQAASKLRRQLQLARLPELKLLCLAEFFKIVDKAPTASIESYIREFLPFIDDASTKSNPTGFLPNEIDGLKSMLDILKIQPPDIVASGDYVTLERLIEKLKSESFENIPLVSARHDQVCIRCIFVEYYPDLELDSRGRILNLLISASPISSRVESDDVNVRNPVEKPDDRFLEQARQSVKAARDYLHRQYGLSAKKRYRFDFAVDSTGARFTGDSLGVAFAVGAIAAVGRVEVFRKRISIPSTVAFSGALNADGKLAPIDSEALKLKIYRAFHSNLSHLIVPREHGVEALEYVKQLEKETSDRRLDIALADDLDHVMADPRLVRTEIISWSAYAGKKIFQIRRSIWVEIPALIILAAILFYLIAPPQWMPWFDDNPAYASINVDSNCLEAFNRENQLVWKEYFECPLENENGSECYKVLDLDGDGESEVLFLSTTISHCDERAWLYCFSPDGELRFKRYCAIANEFPADTQGVYYYAVRVSVTEVNKRNLIITEVSQQCPMRAHIRLWSAEGDSLGWYINRGGSCFCMAGDLDQNEETELYFLNYNNPMNSVAMLVINADSSRGVSPPYDDLDEREIIQGNQIKYILLPPSELARVPNEVSTKYNHPGGEGIHEDITGILTAYTTESMISQYAKIIYSINDHYRVIQATPTDQYLKRWQELVDSARVLPMDSEFFDRIRDSVKYWKDSGWITEGELRAAENKSK
ncbi:MAG: hypothetical protein AB1746_06170 [Candidatus Zixiibacteriota bacterium]